jgi:hypothetical protein
MCYLPSGRIHSSSLTKEEVQFKRLESQELNGISWVRKVPTTKNGVTGEGQQEFTGLDFKADWCCIGAEC